MVTEKWYNGLPTVRNKWYQELAQIIFNYSKNLCLDHNNTGLQGVFS